MWKEFKEFISRGSVVDLAIGVIIGAAFGKIVNSLVADVIMPVLGIVIGGINFTALKLTIREKTDVLPGLALNYGNFIQEVLNFLIIAAALFFVIKAINRFRRKKEEPAILPAPPEDVALLREIRDLLKEKR